MESLSEGQRTLLQSLCGEQALGRRGCSEQKWGSQRDVEPAWTWYKSQVCHITHLVTAGNSLTTLEAQFAYV